MRAAEAAHPEGDAPPLTRLVVIGDRRSTIAA
jgi:hypothetical protein